MFHLQSHQLYSYTSFQDLNILYDLDQNLMTQLDAKFYKKVVNYNHKLVDYLIKIYIGYVYCAVKFKLLLPSTCILNPNSNLFSKESLIYVKLLFLKSNSIMFDKLAMLSHKRVCNILLAKLIFVILSENDCSNSFIRLFDKSNSRRACNFLRTPMVK